MNESLLRAYILTELQRNEKIIALLKGKHGLNFGADADVNHIADEWLSGEEKFLGKLTRPYVKTMVRRYVARRWPEIIEQFRGNESAAKHTLYNLLDAKFNRIGDKVTDHAQD